MRAGTEAVPAIASFGAAAAAVRMRFDEGHCELMDRRGFLERQIVARIPGAIILGKAADRLPNTVAIVHPGIHAETAHIALDLDGIAVSAGSACSSGKVGASHVTAALAKAGLPIDPALGAIRVSFGHETEETALERFLIAYERLARRAEARAAADVAA